MNSWTEIFIRRPVLATVISLVIIVAGLQAINTLTVRQFPETEDAAVVITTAYVGADADLVRGFITTPLERVVASADGIDYIESQSAQGLSTVTARLKLDYDPNEALSEISSKVDQVRGDFPPSAEVPVINIESAASRFAAAYLSFSSEVLEQNEITDYLIRAVQPRLTAIKGVQRAEILGARVFAARIWLKPDRMAALGVSPSQIRRSLAANNFLSAPGQTKGALIQVNLSANTDLQSIGQFRKLAIKNDGADVVRLEEVADVVLGSENYDSEVRFSGQAATFMGIWPMPDANAIDTIARVSEEMEDIKSQLPEGLEARVAYDATEYINNAIREVVKTLSETLLIVVVVIFLFLGSVRSVLVPAVAIPISLIGAVFLMQVFGFSLNLLTLLAIVLSVGLVVDDAIVVVENVERNLSQGKKPFQAAADGIRELVGPIFAMTTTLAAVYAPIGFQGGLTGALFREFAFTLAGAVLISGVVAVTLSPVMSSKLLKPGMEESGLAGRISGGFDWLKGVYSRLLDAALSARPVVYAGWAALSALAVYMFTESPTELAPDEDQGVIFGIMNTPSNSTLEQTSHFAEAVNEAFFSFPETRYTFQITNPGGGFGGMVVAPWGQRERTIFEMLPITQERLAAIPGIQIFPVLRPSLPGGGSFPVEFILASTAETEQILEIARELADRARQSGLFAFGPIIDVKIDQPQAEIRFDRDKAAAMGLSMESLGADVGAMVGGDFVNRFNIAGRSYKVIPQIKRVERLTPGQLKDIHVTGPDGQLVKLGSVADIESRTVPRSLNRFQQLNAVKLSAAPKAPLGQALSFLEDEAAKIMPQGYVIDYTGESRQLRQEGGRFLPAMGLAIVLVFLVLAAQFNSFRDPFIILLGSVPLAMFGSMVFTYLRMPNPNLPFFTDSWTTTLNIYSQVGLVTLVGIIAKNGILIVEFANQLQREGKEKLQAVREAAATRLRPILMTSFATVFGHLPLVLVSGPGAAARNSIGLTICGGMAIGTIFTLFFVPCIYMLLARDHARMDEGRG